MILLVNDDGIHAPGFRQLYRALRAGGTEAVLAVAPEDARSGSSQAITLDRGLLAQPVHEPGFFGFSVDGSPTDCLKLALDVLCPQRPKLVISGINEGPNVGRSLFYSGTVGAAMEAAVLGLPAIAVSQEHEGDPVAAATYTTQLVASLPRRSDLRGRVLNLNCPARSAASWGPLRICQHGLAGFQEGYRPRRDGQGRVRWHLHGQWQVPAHETEHDAGLLSAGHPTVSILQPNLNSQEALPRGLRQALAHFGGGTPEGLRA